MVSLFGSNNIGYPILFGMERSAEERDEVMIKELSVTHKNFGWTFTHVSGNGLVEEGAALLVVGLEVFFVAFIAVVPLIPS